MKAERIRKLPEIIGQDNIEKLKLQKDTLDELRNDLEFIEKQKALY